MPSTATARPAAAPTLILLKILHDPPTPQPRRTFDPQKLEELKKSIAEIRAQGEHGVIQPIVVRPHPSKPGEFERVTGARRVRACRELEIPDVPAGVHELDDDQVREWQLVENLQRADVHPLEEADALKALHEGPRKIPVAELAKKIGKSTAYVYQRMQLCVLTGESRRAFLAERISVGHAFLIARIPDPKHQDQALAAFFDERIEPGDKFKLDDVFHDAPLPLSEATRIVQHDFMLRLADARFDLADAELVPAAGACTSCPKRTGNQRELFADVDKKDDRCTDQACFDGKTRATWEKKAAAAAKSGQRVLDEKETKKVFPYGHDSVAWDGPYVDPKGHVPGDAKGRTWKQVLGKDAPASVIAQSPSGAAVELLPRADAVKALKVKAPDIATKKPAGDDDYKARMKADNEKHRIHVLAVKEAVGKLVAQIEKIAPASDLWGLLADGLWDVIWSEIRGQIVTRRGIEAKGRTDGDRALHAAMKTMKPVELAGLVFEMVLSRGAYSRYGDEGVFKKACAAFKIDVKEIEKRIRDEKAAKKKPAAKAKPAKKGAKS